MVSCFWLGCLHKGEPVSSASQVASWSQRQKYRQIISVYFIFNKHLFKNKWDIVGKQFSVFPSHEQELPASVTLQVNGSGWQRAMANPANSPTGRTMMNLELNSISMNLAQTGKSPFTDMAAYSVQHRHVCRYKRETWTAQGIKRDRPKWFRDTEKSLEEKLPRWILQ